MLRRSRSVRSSRPMDTERWLRSGERRAGGFDGRGGISCRARMGEDTLATGGSGLSISRYHGVASVWEDSSAAGDGVCDSSIGVVLWASIDCRRRDVVCSFREAAEEDGTATREINWD